MLLGPQRPLVAAVQMVLKSEVMVQLFWSSLMDPLKFLTFLMSLNVTQTHVMESS